MTAPRPLYQCMIFPQPDGTFTMNVTISHAVTRDHPGSQWTSPEAPIAGTTADEAHANARAEVVALINHLSGRTAWEES